MQLEVVIFGILCAENYENRLKLLQAIEKKATLFVTTRGICI